MTLQCPACGSRHLLDEGRILKCEDCELWFARVTASAIAARMHDALVDDAMESDDDDE